MATTERGSVRWHRHGWELSLYVDGKRRFRRHQAPNTRAGRREAEDALAAWAAQHAAGADGVTVAELLDRYVTAEGHRWAPSTRAGIGQHITPLVDALGTVVVEDLRLGTIETAYGQMITGGKAPATVRRHHAVLSAALGHAVRWGLIAASPAQGVRLGRARTIEVAELPDLATALAAVDRITLDRLRVAARLALGTGARRGEVAALRWRDVDLDDGQVRIAAAISDGQRGGTKTGRSATIAIDPGTIGVLRRWRPEARRRALELGHRLGDGDPLIPEPLDPTVPWAPERITRAWAHHRTVIKLPVRWHDLRHIHATALLRAGVPVHVVAARLRHSSPKMTLDTYAHVMAADDQAAAAVIGAAQA